MTTFFNKKEDVIDLKLTRFGRMQLSLGKLQPAYYAFFDEDVIYELQYGAMNPVTGGYDLAEDQNKIAERIKTVPRPRIQSSYSGVEAEITELNEHINTGMIDLAYGGYTYEGQKYTLEEKQIYNLMSPNVQTQITKNLVFSMPLGSSELGNQNYPSWDVKFYKAPMDTATMFYSASSNTNVRIPQLTATHTIYTRFNDEVVSYQPQDDSEIVGLEIGDDGLPEIGYPGSGGPSDENTLSSVHGRLATRVFPDGSYITQKQKYLFLDVLERNAGFSRENFEIEVFKTEINPENGTEFHRPLSFFDEATTTLTSQEDAIKNNFPVLDNSYVEYYFDIYTDSEIDEEILCDIDLKNKKADIFVDYELEYECPDDRVVRTYDRSVVDPEEC